MDKTDENPYDEPTSDQPECILVPVPITHTGQTQ